MCSAIFFPTFSRSTTCSASSDAYESHMGMTHSTSYDASRGVSVFSCVQLYDSSGCCCSSRARSLTSNVDISRTAGSSENLKSQYFGSCLRLFDGAGFVCYFRTLFLKSIANANTLSWVLFLTPSSRVQHISALLVSCTTGEL